MCSLVMGFACFGGVGEYEARDIGARRRVDWDCAWDGWLETKETNPSLLVAEE